MKKQLILILVLFISMTAKAQTTLPAFPGAEGFGAFSIHGRGGKIIEVTNLNDDGIGSLRNAIMQKGSRIIIFKVGGIIELKTKLNIFEPYCLIAGQTAPGDGICLKGSGINVATHDVVIRYIRSRPGDGAGEPAEDRDGIMVFPYAAYNNSREAKAYNIVIDHCSVSWAIDESVSFYGSLFPKEEIEVKNISLQWCIISEALFNSIHPKGGHSMGILVAGGAYNISIHHNIMAHNAERHPLFKTGTNGEVVNNILYNCPTGIGLVTEDNNSNHPNKAALDIVGNYALEGNNSLNKGYIASFDKRYLTKSASIYVQDNICRYRVSDVAQEWNAINLVGINQTEIQSASRFFNVNTASILKSKDVKDILFVNAGATLPKRDAVDTRIINEIKNKTGKIIDSPSEVGGYPTYSTGKAYEDTDKDGMPNDWEIKYGFNPNNLSDGNEDADKDGYTNVEEFLNGTNPKENITDVNEVEVINQITIYPNPAQDLITISNAPLGSEIKLLDLQGIELISQKATSENTELNIQALPQGLYLLKVGNSVKKLTVE